MGKEHMFEVEKTNERVILVGVCTGQESDVQESLDELEELVKTAGAVCAGRLVQNREQIHPGTYVGMGKLQEIKDLLWETEAVGIVCDDELSPAQIGNLKEELNTKIMDRTLLILDIFASRATTSEGKIQVELAQLKYRQSRLTGFGTSLSRLGGGIGTRGPGEKKLETDRRLIKSRIARLNRDLKEIKNHREVTREQRKREMFPVIAIVGYTNAGKSTLLNRLTGAEVLAEDKLFATLDATTRGYCLPGGQQILFTDTVGFIRKLPHHLVEAFRSTLEEARYADVILHVVDAASPQMDVQMHIVYETLQNLGIQNKPVITAFNKQDLLTEQEVLRDFKADETVHLSALTGEGIDSLEERIEKVLREQKIAVEHVFSYRDAARLQSIRKFGELVSEEYLEEGIAVKAYVPVRLYKQLLEDGERL
ncbi:MAG: GTPase HflX [Dorea sp.]|nr:GTPase HflX [Dorea sp.]